MAGYEPLSRAELLELLAEQDRVLAGRDAEIAKLRTQIAAMEQRLARLERLVSRNSGNSSFPPSMDDQPGRTPPPGKPARGRGKRRPGKQPGSPGHHLAWREDPDDRVRAVTAHAPAMEGGIAVAPASFGGYGGDLVAAGEASGRIFAVAPDGAVVTLAASGLPRGGDIGVESTGFVPPGFGARDAAYLADRYSRGNRHPGDEQHPAPARRGTGRGRRPGRGPAGRDRGQRTHHRGALRPRLHRAVHRHRPDITHAEGHIAFTGPGR